MKPAPPAPTLEQLRRHSPWCWVVCERCLHRRPVAFVPLIIRFGPDASSNLIRRSARCTKCGGKGATLQHPGWLAWISDGSRSRENKLQRRPLSSQLALL